MVCLTKDDTADSIFTKIEEAFIHLSIFPNAQTLESTFWYAKYTACNRHWCSKMKIVLGHCKHAASWYFVRTAHIWFVWALPFILSSFLPPLLPSFFSFFLSFCLSFNGEEKSIISVPISMRGRRIESASSFENDCTHNSRVTAQWVVAIDCCWKVLRILRRQ